MPMFIIIKLCSFVDVSNFFFVQLYKETTIQQNRSSALLINS